MNPQVQKKSIEKNLQVGFDKVAGIKTLVNPQNFFVIDNPDLLITKGNFLYGIFIPSKKEIKDIDNLIRRIYLSRLVYANDLRVVLVLEDSSVLIKTPILQSSCHLLAMEDQINDIPFIIEGDNSSIQKKMLSREIRCYAANSYYQYSKAFNATYQFANNYSNINPGGNWTKINPIHRWSNIKKEKSVNESFQYEDKILFNKSSKNNKNLKESLNDLMTFALYSKFVMDNGLLYRKKESNFGILNIELLDLIRQNSLILSTLAFLGLLPTCVKSMEDVNKITEETYKIFNNGK